MDSTVPSESAENVSRSSAIIITMIADGVIPKEQLSVDYFRLEDLGKDYKPQPTATATPTSAASRDAKAKEEKPQETTAPEKSSDKSAKEKNDNVTANSALPYAIYVLNIRSGVGDAGKQVAFDVILSPTELLQPDHTYRLTVSKTLKDDKKNELAADYTTTFKTGSTPDDVETKIAKFLPADLKVVPNDATPTAPPPAATPETTAASGSDDAEKPKVEITTVNEGTHYAHPEQDFRIEFAQPTSASRVKKLIRFKREALTKGERETAIDFKILHVDKPASSEKRLQSFIVRADEELVDKETYLLSVGRKTMRLVIDAAEATLKNDLVNDDEVLIGLDDLKLIKKD